MLRLPESAWLEMAAHAVDSAPNECCGLIAGRVAGPNGKVEKVYRMANAEAESPRTRYVLDSREQLGAMKGAEADGREIIACFHSHTHTEPYPSETDVERAGYPEWWYLIIGLKDGTPIARAYRIVEGEITEDRIVVER